jgi:pimeloyl-ACP methyl ester carboxylesterase
LLRKIAGKHERAFTKAGMTDAVDHAAGDQTRRAAIGRIGIGVIAALAAEPAPAQTQRESFLRESSVRKTFVLVHGSSAGGWCYRRVADLLEAHGHKVFAPTLTGLGERSHLMSGAITLDTHIADVVNVIRWEGLEDITLVGHSYGGWIISGVAEEMEKKIASIVFLDAFMPENGQRVLDTNSARSRAEIEAAVARGEVSRPPPHPSVWNVNVNDQAWVAEKFTAQPVGVAFTPIRLSGARERIAKKTYVRATGYANPNFERAYAKVKADPSWRTFELPCGHETMIDMPERTAEILLEVA